MAIKCWQDFKISGSYDRSNNTGIWAPEDESVFIDWCKEFNCTFDSHTGPTLFTFNKKEKRLDLGSGGGENFHIIIKVPQYVEQVKFKNASGESFKIAVVGQNQTIDLSGVYWYYNEVSLGYNTIIFYKWDSNNYLNLADKFQLQTPPSDESTLKNNQLTWKDYRVTNKSISGYGFTKQGNSSDTTYRTKNYKPNWFNFIREVRWDKAYTTTSAPEPSLVKNAIIVKLTNLTYVLDNQTQSRSSWTWLDNQNRFRIEGINLKLKEDAFTLDSQYIIQQGVEHTGQPITKKDVLNHMVSQTISLPNGYVTGEITFDKVLPFSSISFSYFDENHVIHSQFASLTSWPVVISNTYIGINNNFDEHPEISYGNSYSFMNAINGGPGFFSDFSMDGGLFSEKSGGFQWNWTRYVANFPFQIELANTKEYLVPSLDVSRVAYAKFTKDDEGHDRYWYHNKLVGFRYSATAESPQLVIDYQKRIGEQNILQTNSVSTWYYSKKKWGIITLAANDSYPMYLVIPYSLIGDFETYTITTQVTNGTSSGDTSIFEFHSASVNIQPESGYSLPNEIIVTGANYTYNSSTGVVSLSNPIGPVTITATCLTQGHSVSCSSYNNPDSAAFKAYYSTDNGTTWAEITNTGILTNNATQVKFRVDIINIGGSPSPGGLKISSETLGFSIGGNYNNYGTYYSDNYTLTQNITDIVVDEYSEPPVITYTLTLDYGGDDDGDVNAQILFKYNSAPTSMYDCDNRGNWAGITDKDGYLINNPHDITDVHTVYVWTNTGSYSHIKLDNTSSESVYIPQGYANAMIITLTKNTTIYTYAEHYYS